MRKRLLIVAYIFLFTLPLASAEPWWNTSWNYKKQITITNNNLSQTLEQGYTVNATFNHSQLVSAGKSVANGSDVRALWYDSTSWWNSSWNYRKKITITNNNLSQVLEQNYTVNITLDTTGSKFVAAGNDTRIVWWNGTNNVELDRINTTAFNAVNTSIWFKLQKNISANSWDDNYYVYYGNPSAGSPPANWTNVFLFYDDFNEGGTCYNNNIGPVWTVRSGGVFDCNNGYLTTNGQSNFDTDSIYASLSITPLNLNSTGIVWSYKTKAVAENSEWNILGIMNVTGHFGSDAIGYYMDANIIGNSPGTADNRKFSIAYNTDYGRVLIGSAGYPNDKWYEFKVTRSPSGLWEFFIDGASVGTIVNTTISHVSYMEAWHVYEGNTYWDDIILRKYMSPEPSAALGAEQGQSRYVELDRVNTTAFNNAAANTVLWFKTQANIPAGGRDANYSLYYGNPSAGAAPANGSNVYHTYIDFEDYSTGELHGQQGWTASSTGVFSVVANGINGKSMRAYDTASPTTYNIYHPTNINFDYVQEFKINFTTLGVDDGGVYPITKRDSSNNYESTGPYFQSPRRFGIYAYGGSWQECDVQLVWDYNKVYSVTMIKNQSKFNVRLNDTWCKSGSGITTVSNLPNEFGVTTGSSNPSEDALIDDIRIRRYLSPEPSTSLGAEEDNIPPQITISSPLNTTYSTTSVWLNYSVNESSLDWVGYSLDGASNVTTNTNTGEIDVEASYSCSGPFRDVRPCSNAVDENWVTFAGPEAGSTASVIENFSVKNYENPKGIIFTYRFAASGTYRYDLSIYDFSSSVWKLLASWTGQDFSTKNTSTITQNITNYIRDNVISFKSDAIDFGASYTVVYSEGKVTLINYTNTSIPLTSLSEGSHNIVVSANDTAGNLNSSRVFFTVDTTPPTISIQSPSNTTYATTSIWANITLNEAGSWCGRSLDGATNTTLTNSSGNWNNLMSVSDGSHNVKFFCNDTTGNMNQSELRYFSVNTTPLVNISLNPSKSWWNDLINASGAILASGQSLSDITVTVELNNKIQCTDQTDANGLWTCTFNAPNELGSYTVKANITLSGNSTSATTTLKVAPSWGHVFSSVANRFAHQMPILIQEPSGRIHWVWVTVVVGIA